MYKIFLKCVYIDYTYTTFILDAFNCLTALVKADV